ncbi:MAG: hypothetical protein OEZ38_03880, partial [Gammaproteobacteria bacterium]|nr:hypothetical protein [Gammaproteobacteria bacterium]
MALIDLWGDLITEYSLSLILVWVIMAMLVLYVGRIPCHNILKICSLSIGRIFRNFSKSAERNEKQINNRNREILLAYGRESSERYLERAFQRLAVQVNSQLGSYPGLHQKLSDQFKSIDEDYRRSADEPPRPPEWLKAIEAVAEIPANDSPVVASILGDIHKTMRKALDKNIVEYKAAIKERHLLLKKIKPYWVYLSGILKGLDGKIAGIDKRTRKIDEYMEKYESMLKDPDRAERVLTKSLFKDLVVSVFLLCIGISGIYVNFYLIALPMEEIVGAGSSLNNMKASDMAAIFLTGIEISIGIILMDALGLTRLFTSISDSADDRKKRF